MLYCDIDFLIARKLVQDVRYPEIKGKVCRALPYEKDVIKRVDSNAGLFIKGFGKLWTHKDIFENFKQFGDIISAKVSIDENHMSRGYGFV